MKEKEEKKQFHFSIRADYGQAFKDFAYRNFRNLTEQFEKWIHDIIINEDNNNYINGGEKIEQT